MTKWVRQVPNTLTLSRIFLAALFPLLPPTARLGAIVAALLTEFLDGFLARRLHAETAFGQLMDPVADKLFILSVIGTLMIEHRFGLVAFLLFTIRDWTVTIGTIVLRNRRSPVPWSELKPRTLGKLTTALQFAFLVCLFLWPRAAPALFVVTTSMSLASACNYVIRFRQAGSAQPH